MAESDTVCNYLIMREASGKGSLIDTEIVISDAQTLDVDKLYVAGTVNPVTPAFLANDDNAFIGKILYSGALELQRNGNRNGNYEEKLRKAYDNEIKSPANNSLAYKIMAMTQEQQEQIVEKLKDFEKDQILQLYNEAKSLEKARNKKGQFARSQFIEALSRDDKLGMSINNFYKKVSDCLNEEIDNFRSKIEDWATIEEETAENWQFYLALGADTDQEIAEYLLKSEAGSREYLFSSLSLTFRGASWLFDHDEVNALNVGETDGVPFRALRLIDTMGLFHDTGVTKEDECDHIIDILSNYHTKFLLFAYNMDIDVTVKNALETMREFLRTAKFNTSVITLVTKLDLFLASNMNPSRGTGRFEFKQQSAEERQNQAERAYNMAVALQSSYERSFRDDLSGNDNKHKPDYVGQILYGLPGSDAIVDGLLQKKQRMYKESVQSFVELLCQQVSKKPKIRVINPDDILQNHSLKQGPRNVDAIIQSLVDCKNLKLYASTVAAANRKWPLELIHKSVVMANDWGYVNIETKFVYPMGNYGRDLLDNITLNAKCFATAADRAAFEAAFQTEKTRLGKLFVAEVYRDVYQRGFLANPTVYMPQYKRFQKMLDLTIRDYFPQTPISPTTSAQDCVIRAIRKLISDIVDYQCIVVY
jgi:hypothetical protein